MIDIVEDVGLAEANDVTNVPDAAAGAAPEGDITAPPAQSPAGVGRPERRSDKRWTTVFRVAKLCTDREELCLGRNVSAGGLKAEVFSSKTVGERVAVDFGDNQPRPATVVWVDDNRVGIRFAHRINVAKVLANAPDDRRGRRLRFVVRTEAVLLKRRRRELVHMTDISQGGAQLRTDFAVAIGDRIKLDIAGLGTISGTARWRHEDNVGVSFTTPIPYRQLAGWIATMVPPKFGEPGDNSSIADSKRSNASQLEKGKSGAKTASKKTQDPAPVIGPLGELLTLASLPPPNTTRWVIRRKAEVVAAVNGGLLSTDEACERYGLSIEEFASWQRAVMRFGMLGLRVTHSQRYKSISELHS